LNILVTGATGFLGTALCDRLEAGGHSLTKLGSREADLRVRGSLDAFSPGAYDQIYHLAAWTQAGDFCLRHPGEQWIINQLINTHMLEWWQRAQPKARFVSIGTSCSYSPDLPLAEEHYLHGTPIDSLFTYAQTKRMLLVGQMALQKQFGLRWLTLVPSTLYGPGYHTDGRQMHFIFDLIRKILRAKLYGDEVVLWGDGHQKRELVYIDDFVSAALELGGTHDNELINIGAGEEFSIRDFAAMICSETGYEFSKIKFDTSRYTGAQSKCLDTQKLRRLLPQWRQRHLKEGLSLTVQWFLEHRESTLPPINSNL